MEKSKNIKLKDLPPLIITVIVVLIMCFAVNIVYTKSIHTEIKNMKREITKEIQSQSYYQKESVSFPMDDTE